MKADWIIGTADSCDVVAKSPFISGAHCRLELDERGWAITDLGSTNGTFVNGIKTKGKTRIRRSDRVTLGRSVPLPWPDASTSSTIQNVPPTVTPTPAVSVVRQQGLPVTLNDVTIHAAGKRLVENVSLCFEPGEMVGVMGPSGAGKSTLLSAIVGILQPSCGDVRIGGMDISTQGEAFGVQVGYVPQDDIMHTDLTVWQALWYSARLRLPSSVSDTALRERVQQVITHLGLQGLEHTRIGSPDRRGISGGQRKRVNVALELLTDPQVLILDEPTSGLSSTEALGVVSLLRRLADEGKTVILTIHQPGNDALRLFDAIAVVAKDESTEHVGSLVWYGPPLPDAVDFFDPSPTEIVGSPSGDAILRGLATRSAAAWRSLYKSTRAHQAWVINRGRVAFEPSDARHVTPLARPDVVRQWRVLTARAIAVKAADRWNSAILLCQAPLIACLVAAIFGHKARPELNAVNVESVSSAVGMATFLMGLASVWLGCSNSARELVGERAIYRRERMVGLSPAAYLCSKVTLLSILCLLQCSVLLQVMRSGCRLQGDVWFALCVLVLAAEVGVGMGLLVSAVARTTEAAAAMLPLLIIPMVVLGGSLLPLPELPVVAAEAADLIPTRWAFEGLLLDEAAARPAIEVPLQGQPDKLAFRDVAERWFPRDGWRSPRNTPVLALVLLSLAFLWPLFITFGSIRRADK